MIDYTYSLSESFPRGLSQDLLSRQIVDALGSSLDSVGEVGDVVSISFSEPLPDPNALTALVAAHDPFGYSFADNYLEEEYETGRIVRRTWFAYKSGKAYLYKVTEWTYAYDSTGAYLLHEQNQSFDSLGAIVITRQWVYLVTRNDSGNTVVRKEEVL